MSTALAIRNDADRSVTWTESAHEMIAEALETAALIGRVTTADENEAAVDAQRRIKAAQNEIEKVRKILKDPVIEFGRTIDAAARKICEPLGPEEMRIAALVGDFAQLQEATRKAAEAARLLELEQIERARLEKLNQLAREEAARNAAFHAQSRKAQQELEAARSQNEAEKAAQLQAEIDRQKALAEAQSFDRMNAIQEKFNIAAAGVKPVEAMVRATGQVVRPDMEIQEIREWELAKARPDLVRRIEFDLIEIKRLLNTGVKLPGVIAKPVVKSSVRAGRAEIVNV